MYTHIYMHGSMYIYIHMYIYNCIYIFLPIHTMFMSMLFHVFTLELVKSEKGPVGCGNGNVFLAQFMAIFPEGKCRRVVILPSNVFI